MSMERNPYLFASERFMSIQGEGYWTGMPSWFIRLQGCSVGCSWCDTKHTWKSGVGQVSVDELVSEVPCNAAHVVVTGGEPYEQDISHLITRLGASGKFVQVETSGAYETYGRCWITVSPKAGRGVTESAQRMASEFKQVVSSEEDVRVLKDAWEGRSDWLYMLQHGLVSLQPMDNDADLTKLCIELCKSYGFRLSIQAHKMIGVR